MTDKITAAVKSRPILFSGPMVRAILAGNKTQTRRVLRSQPYTLRTEGFGYPTRAGGFVAITSPHCLAECPFGSRGDRLWVRETWAPYDDDVIPDKEKSGIGYRADLKWGDIKPHADEGWRPSIFMPRWASRITLEVTGVRVERLQDISSEDAELEGVKCYPLSAKGFVDYYRELWDSINAKRAPWSSNPWVWCISFRSINASVGAGK